MKTPLETAPERTGWRDERISRRHRMWGWDCPAVDIDLLMLEYDRGLPAALVEFKHEKAATILMGHPSVRALRVLSDRASIPFFLVRYADDLSWFYVTPGNDNALQYLPEARKMGEPEWIALLYRCRGRDVPDGLSGQVV